MLKKEKEGKNKDTNHAVTQNKISIGRIKQVFTETILTYGKDVGRT